MMILFLEIYKGNPISLLKNRLPLMSKVNTIENKESTQDVRALSNYATPSSISAFNSPIRSRSKKERQGFFGSKYEYS